LAERNRNEEERPGRQSKERIASRWSSQATVHFRNWLWLSSASLKPLNQEDTAQDRFKVHEKKLLLTKSLINSMEIAVFVFNPFAENTFVLYDETGECIIVDPGCNNRQEEKALKDFIDKGNLKPVRLINTHFHIDHVLGNHFVARTYDLKPEIHEEGMYFFELQPQIAASYGIPYTPGPKPEVFLDEGDSIRFGNTVLAIYHVPATPGVAFVFTTKPLNP
jgi:hypothetical protein